MSDIALSQSNSEDNIDVCNCGRSKHRPHCPYCGRTKLYAYAEKWATRAHPVTGIVNNDIPMFRCEVCGKQFDNYQWQFECKAPVMLSKLHAERRDSEMEKWRRRAMSGVKFDENDRRAFRKAVKVSYYDFMQAFANAEKLRIKMEFQKLGLQGTDTPVISTTSSSKIVIEEKAITPYQVHIESCNKFAIDQQCDICDNLLKAEVIEKEKK
jgi:hypothetical protein